MASNSLEASSRVGVLMFRIVVWPEPLRPDGAVPAANPPNITALQLAQRAGTAIATLFTPLHARYSSPLGVATMLRTTPPPEGMEAEEKCSVRGSNRTSVFGLTPDSLNHTILSLAKISVATLDMGRR